MKKIAFDVMSGDKGYEVALGAALSFMALEKKGHIIFVGDQAKIESFIKDDKNKKLVKKIKPEWYSIVNATQVIAMTDGPLEVRRKSDSSLAVAIKLVKTKKADAILSAGASAAFITGVYLELGVVQKGVKPFFCGVYKNLRGMAYFGDSGANIDTSPQNLVDYARIMSVVAKANGNEKPNVGLLNNGSEKGKGLKLQQEAYELLSKDKSITFIGNVEGNQILNGPQEVTVAEGFSGNTTSKAVEGTLNAFNAQLKHSIKTTSGAKLGYLFMKRALKKLKNVFDARVLGGAPILGLNAIAMKAHGGSGDVEFYYSLKYIIHYAEIDLLTLIKQGLKKK